MVGELTDLVVETSSYRTGVYEYEFEWVVDLCVESLGIVSLAQV